MSKKYEMDLTSGPVARKVLIYAFPIMLSGILQLLFNAADVIVVGRFAGKESLAAVGSTSSLINLLINLFVGISVGCNVIVAKSYGSGKEKDIRESVHTSVALSFISGIILVFVGFFTARFWLLLMGTPEDVIGKSVLYMRIFFLGMPVIMSYNFGSAILRAVGDTKRPLYYLSAAGVLNVILNLFFVIGLKMDVAGVAMATVISQVLSAFLVLRCLTRLEGPLKLNLRELSIEKGKLKQILQIGLPAGMQGIVFSISNVLIQSSVNSFGSVVMAGNSAAMNIESFVYIAMNAFYQANLSFTSQNVGAGRYDRIRRILFVCEGYAILFGVLLGWLVVLNGKTFLGIYSSDPEVIKYGLIRLWYISGVYFFCGMMDTLVGSIRGLGYSVLPMIVSVTGVCGFRIVWILLVFSRIHTLPVLYLSYLVSWVITFLLHAACFGYIYRKRIRPRIMASAAE